MKRIYYESKNAINGIYSYYNHRAKFSESLGFKLKYNLKNFSQIDILWTGLNAKYWEEEDKNILKKININTLFISLHKPQDFLREKLLAIKELKTNKIIITCPLKAILKYAITKNIEKDLTDFLEENFIFIPYNAQENKEKEINKEYFYGFSGALHSFKHGAVSYKNIRLEMVNSIPKDKVSCYLNGSDNIKKFIKNEKYYRKIISKTKFWIFTQGPIDDVGARLIDIIRCRSIPLMPRLTYDYYDLFDYENDVLEYKDGYHEKALTINNDEYKRRLANLDRILNEKLSNNVLKEKMLKLIND